MAEEDSTLARKHRRSERLYLSIPIRVFATDPNGRAICEDALTVAVNRHGARIRLENQLVLNDEINIANLSNGKEDDFRVVGQVSKPQGDNSFSDWGVECLNPQKNLWDMEFKDSPEDAGAASALLECCSCNQACSVQLGYEEVETLSNTQLLSRRCERCRDTTFWKAASTDRRRREVPPEARALSAVGLPQQTSPPPPTPPASGAEAAPAPAPQAAQEKRAGLDRRQEKRIALRVPLRIRTAEGAVEVAKTENLSRSGARFLSERNYSKEETLFVAAPYTPGEEPIESKGLVEEIEELPGSPGRLYSIRFLGRS